MCPVQSRRSLDTRGLPALQPNSSKIACSILARHRASKLSISAGARACAFIGSPGLSGRELAIASLESGFTDAIMVESGFVDTSLVESGFADASLVESGFADASFGHSNSDLE